MYTVFKKMYSYISYQAETHLTCTLAKHALQQQKYAHIFLFFILVF